MKENFSFHMPVRVVYEKGISQKLNQYITSDTVLLICDPFLYQNGTAEKIGQSLVGKTVAYFSDIEPNPSCESVDLAAAKAREISANCIVGLGGGSAMDVSKIVTYLATHEGSIYDYYSGGSKKLVKREAELVLIPTTSGTGSEVTNVGVYTNKKVGIKMPLVTDCFWADVAVLDPELTYTLPPAVTASTGMDAFCHAIEAYWNKESQPMCDMLALGAMKSIMENIKTAYKKPQDQEARGYMLQASLIAGVAFSQTRTTGIHALSFPLTTEFGANHGTACAITLPAFIRCCKEGSMEKLTALSNYLGYATADKLADAVEDLMETMGLPTRLHQIGVKESDLEHITKVGLGAAIIQLTPAEMNEKTVYELLESIL